MEREIRIQNLLMCKAKHTSDGKIVLEIKNGKKVAQATWEEIVDLINEFKQDIRN